MLILGTLTRGDALHGVEIAGAVQRASPDVLPVEDGSLYPALQRMLIKGWIRGTWGRTADSRRARPSRLRPAGRRQFNRKVVDYTTVSAAIVRILRPA